MVDQVPPAPVAPAPGKLAQDIPPAAPAVVLPIAEGKKENQQVFDLRKAAERVNETKADYDQCESRRMREVMNGRDLQEISCEREFANFKKAFDVQLMLESRMPPVVVPVHPGGPRN